MTTMQAMMWTVDSDLKVSVASRSEDNGLFPALIHRPIANQPHVAMDQLPVGIEDLLQVRGPRLFLALPYEANICPQRDLGRSQCIERRELGEDGCLVIPSRPGVDARLAINFANHRCERRTALPLRRSDRLAVVMRIEHDGMLRARNSNLPVNDRRRAGNRQQLRFDASVFEHLNKQVGVSL